MHGVVFLPGSEYQVAIVDANDFSLGQRYTFAIADAEGIESSRWAQARFGIIVLDIQKGFHFGAAMGDVRKIHVFSGFNVVHGLFSNFLRSIKDILGGNTTVLSRGRGQDGRSQRPRWADPARQHDQSSGTVAQTRQNVD